MAKKQKPRDDVKAAQDKLSAKTYNELLGSLELQSIFLKEIKASLSSNELSGRGQFSFTESPSLVEHSPDAAVLDVSYSLIAKSGRKRMMEVKCKYRATFSTSKELPPEFFTLYSRHSLPLQTFPYLRELVNSLFSRMGLPPLILPLRKYLVGQ